MSTTKVTVLLPWLVAALIALIRSSNSTTDLSKTSKPHVLFLLIDDLGWTDISKHNSEFQTKNIDNLMESGIELTNYYIHLTCSPTRSAIMTGQYSFKNGLQDWATIPTGSTQHIPFMNPTLPELLKKANYTTHMMGKWHLGYSAWNMTPTGRGFDSHYGYFQGAQDYYDHSLANGFDFFLNQKVQKQVIGNYSTGLYQQYMQDLLDNYTKTAQSEPLFIYMAFQTVHAPIEISPNEYAACDHVEDPNRKIYCNQMQYLDNVIGNYINLFKIHNLWDNTVLILSTDNGGMPYWGGGQNAMVVSWGCNMPFRAGKSTLFEGGVHGVGFVNGGDNIIPSHLRGTQSSILTHAIDWVPTILEGIVNDPLPDNVPFDGINMWPALMNPSEPSLWNRTTLYIDIEQNGSFAGIIDGDYKYFEGKQLYTAYFPCNGTYTPYDNTSESGTEWLFNLKTDPFEYNNLARTNRDLVNKYKNMIQDFIQNDGYIPEQDRKIYNEALPVFHDGVWLPWMN